ncbi:hypothetical protein Tco_1383317 [Tanacetum coccineum]
MDANKKVDLENPLCPYESRILVDILKNHPLRFCIAASSSVPWIYMGQFWHTLHEDRSKYTLKFMLDKKECTLTLNDFRTIFHLPQATNNNHDHFVPAPTFSKMVPFYINDLGFTLELRSISNFKTSGRLQPWQTLCKMFLRCLTTRVTSYDQPAVQIIFTKPIVSLYMTAYPEISRRVRNRYHNLADDVMIKSIFNSGKSKDVPTTQSQLIESTQGTHRTTSAPRSPNTVVAEGESNTLQVSLVKQKSHEELEATQNVEKVKEHLIAEEIEKLIEGSENVEETVEVLVHPLGMMMIKLIPTLEEEESVEDDYELRRREKGKYVEEIRNTPSPITIRSPRIPTNLPGRFRLYKSFFKELQGLYGYLFEHLSAKFMPRRKFNELAKNLEDIMMEALPKLVDDRIKVQFRRTSLTGFPDQSVRSYNVDALDSPYLLVLNTRTSQSSQHDMSESDSYYLSD